MRAKKAQYFLACCTIYRYSIYTGFVSQDRSLWRSDGSRLINLIICFLELWTSIKFLAFYSFEFWREKVTGQTCFYAWLLNSNFIQHLPVFYAFILASLSLSYVRWHDISLFSFLSLVKIWKQLRIHNSKSFPAVVHLLKFSCHIFCKANIWPRFCCAW